MEAEEPAVKETQGKQVLLFVPRQLGDTTQALHSLRWLTLNTKCKCKPIIEFLKNVTLFVSKKCQARNENVTVTMRNINTRELTCLV